MAEAKWPEGGDTNAEVALQDFSDENGCRWTAEDMLAVVCEWIDEDGGRLAAFEAHLKEKKNE